MLEAKSVDTDTSAPTPPKLSGALPLLGNALEFYRDQEAFFRRGYREHGKVFAINLLGQDIAVMVGPEQQSLFFKETDKSLDMEKPYGFLAAMFGKIAFLGNHDTYMRHRPILHSMFGREQMADYLLVMSQVVNEWMDGLGDEGVVDISAEMVDLVKEVAGRCFLGDEVNGRLKAAGFWKQYDALGESLDPLLYRLPLPKFIRRDRARARIGEILLPLIEERRRQPRDDSFQHLLDQPDGDGEVLPDDIVASFFSAFMFAGHETTAGQAAWSIIHMADNDDYRAQTLAEVSEVLGERDEVDHVALRKLPKVNAAVKESGRLRPSAETLIREVKEEIKIDGYRIPADWFVMTSTAAAHFIPEYYAEPYQYDPARFTERGEGRGFELITFGGGLHKCTGMNFASAEMAVILTLLFKNYELELVTPYDEIAVERVSSSKPGPAMVRCKRRDG